MLLILPHWGALSWLVLCQPSMGRPQRPFAYFPGRQHVWGHRDCFQAVYGKREPSLLSPMLI